MNSLTALMINAMVILSIALRINQNLENLPGVCFRKLKAMEIWGVSLPMRAAISSCGIS